MFLNNMSDLTRIFPTTQFILETEVHVQILYIFSFLKDLVELQQDVIFIYIACFERKTFSIPIFTVAISWKFFEFYD